MKNLNETGKIIPDATIACMVLFLRSITKKKQRKTPEHILEQKFSEGEIDVYEYNQRKRQLQRDEDLKIKMFLLSRT